MSEEIKFEAVFGDQSLFDNAPLGTELVGHSGGFYKNSPDGPIYCGGCTFTTDEYRNIGFIAARRIIKSPVWTKADQEMGLMPEVGAGLTHESEGDVSFIGEYDCRWMLRTKYNGLYLAEKFYCYPIETPEERAKRVRDEWCNNAAKQLKNLEYSSTLTSIYDALLSGELKMPEVQK